MRNLFLFLLLLVAVYLVRRALSRADDAADKPAAQPEAARDAEQVLPCAQCGVLVPASEGVIRGAGFFCSTEHADLGPRAG
ncbi:PP0621 family protein [Viridibacterium curvum]|uniref:Deaminase n=1 Tax=Viridibacterium curvum TaxID=1101404 RepID=A0ABP9QAM1_9RHOO